MVGGHKNVGHLVLLSAVYLQNTKQIVAFMCVMLFTSQSGVRYISSTCYI